MTGRLAFTLFCLCAVTAARAESAHSGTWAMQASLDGKPIGTHRFVVTGPADGLRLESRADFDVKVLGFSAYTYHHEATEQWQGDCLDTLDASTDDNGKKSVVTLRRDGDAMKLTSNQGRQSLPSCVMSFAYWNPSMLKASHLLNPQTGKYESVRVTDLGLDTIDASGRKVEAKHYRIDGPERPIELWYSAAGDWLALDSMVGRRRLSYRRE